MYSSRKRIPLLNVLHCWRTAIFTMRFGVYFALPRVHYIVSHSNFYVNQCFLFREIDLTTCLRIQALVAALEALRIEFWRTGIFICVLVYTSPYLGRNTSPPIVISM